MFYDMLIPTSARWWRNGSCMCMSCLRVSGSNPTFCTFTILIFSRTYRYVPVWSRFVSVYTGIYQYILELYMYVVVYTSMYYVCLSIHCYIQYVPGLSEYILVCTWFVLVLTILEYSPVHRGTLHCLLRTYFWIHGTWWYVLRNESDNTELCHYLPCYSMVPL